MPCCVEGVIMEVTGEGGHCFGQSAQDTVSLLWVTEAVL